MMEILQSGQGQYHHQFFFNPYKDQLKALEQMSASIDPSQLEKIKAMAENIDKQIEEYKKRLV